jgi:hypothetical protein
MQLNAESEWMKSQKHAEVMSPDGHFEVVQTDNECTLYFSLGTDSVVSYIIHISHVYS